MSVTNQFSKIKKNSKLKTQNSKTQKKNSLRKNLPSQKDSGVIHLAKHLVKYFFPFLNKNFLKMKDVKEKPMAIKPGIKVIAPDKEAVIVPINLFLTPQEILKSSCQ